MISREGAADTDERFASSGVSLVELFEEQVARLGDATAVSGVDGELSFSELDRRANGLARHLQQLGVEIGDRVAVRMSRGADVFVALLAVLKAGAAYVPVDPRYPTARQMYVVEHSRATALLTQRALLADLPDDLAAPVVLVDDSSCWSAFEQTPLGRSTGPDAVISVLYTSGSTGRPKGVLRRQAGILTRIACNWRVYPYREREIVAQKTTLVFVDSELEIFQPLLAGVPIAVIPDDIVSDPREFVAMLAARDITRLVLVPTLLDAMLDIDDVAARLPALWHWSCSGEALRMPTVRRFLATFPAARLVNLYGSTEVGDATWFDMVDLAADAASVPLGRVLDDVTVTIVDELGTVVREGEVGEIVVAGSVVALGYHDLPEATAERFFEDERGLPAIRMGDLGRWNEQGILEYRGRRDDQVKIRGNRVELGEVESALRQHPGVSAAAVVAREVLGATALVAYVVSPAPLDIGELRDFLRGILPEYMMPAGVVPLERLPHTPNGKVDRKALPEIEAIPLGQRPYVAPVDDLERALAGLFEEILGRTPIGGDDDFFELGGHSLLAARGVARLEALVGVRLSVRDFFEAPTVAGLAERVRAARGAATDVVLQVDEVLPADVPHALSLVQQRFWLFERLRPGTPAFNLPCVVRLRGAVSPEALDLAVRDVLARHAPLRSTFAMGETDPFVRVASVPEHPLRIVDRRGAQFDGDVDALVRDELRTPFDLEQGPLFRATLYRLADDDSVLAAVMHHVVSDGTSIGLFYRDLSLAYRARSEGREPAFAPLELDYQGFAHWQRRRFTPSAIERELDYWRDELKSAPRLLDLPTDRPRLARQTFRGGHEPLEIDAALTRSLRSLAGSERASLFMVLLAAFQTLLGALAGQDDVVVAAPTAGRLERSFEDMIGLFINTLVLRGDLSGEPTFRELLRRTRHKTLAGFEHQDVPFEELVEAIDIDRREGGFAPFFQTLLVLEPDPADDIDLSGLRADAIEVHVGASMFDISLYLMERRDGSVSGYAEYNAEIFDPATIARLSDRLVALLGSAAARPDAPIDDLLHEGASSGVGSIIAMTPGSALDGSLVRLWEARAAAAGASIAVIADDATVTFGELDTRANMLARHLQALGVEPGDRVAVRMTRGADAVLAILAVLKAGAAYVPIDPRYPSDRQAYVLEHSQSAALLTQHALVDEATAALGVPVVAVDIAASWERGDTSPLRIVRGPDDPVYVIYTSGSTGRPKGVLGRQGGTVNRIAWGWRAHPFGDREVVAQRTSLAFVDSVWEIFGPLLGGVPIAVIPDEVVSDPRELVSMLADRGVTRIVLVPTLLDAILESDDDLAARLPALRHWVSSGEALRVPTVRRFNAALPGARLINLYGSSEVSADVTWFDTAELAPDADAVPLGRPLDDVAVALVDEHGEIVPPGAVGEIRVSGAAVALGYHDLPEATAERFVSEPDGAPAFRTGDLARLSSRGLLEYRGRRDDQVKIRGNRVELGEVESVLREHPAVSSASVAVREVASSPALIAYIVSPAPLDMDVLRRFLRKRLPEYMVPVGVVPLATLPLTPSGKVDRDALPDLQAIPLDDQRYVAPIDDVQRELASLFEEILERRPIGVADDFFDLGGHSLLAARLFRRIEQRLEVSLPLSVLLEGASVEDIAKQVVLVRDSPARSRRSVAIQTRGTRRPLFLVPGAGSRLLYLRHLARHLGTEQPLYALHDDPSHGDPAGSVEQLAARLIDDMRAVQPQGPYNLTGFSFGGIVAYEMAQQLTAAGERVASLVLLDTFHPAHPPPAANPGLRGLVRRVEHTVDLLQGFPAGERMTYVRSVASVLRERQMAATWQRLHRLAPKVERYWSDPVGDLERAWFARDSYALATYVPRPYSGRLTFLWAQHNTRTVDIYDTRRGWSELAETVVVPLAGSHATLLLEPLVQGVAASLRTLLAEAEDGD